MTSRWSARKSPWPARRGPRRTPRPAPGKPRSSPSRLTEGLSPERSERGRGTLNPGVPLVAAVFPEAALAAAELGVVGDGLEAHDVLGVFVAELALHPQAQRRPVRHRQGPVVHGVGENGL